MRYTARAALLWCASLLAGCAGTFEHTIQFNPSEPIRVVVLPFVQVNDKGEIIEADPNLLIDNVSLVSSQLKETPAQFLRKLVQNELAKSSLDLVAPAVVDAELSHHGFDAPNVELDTKKIFAARPAEICAHLLSCDAILYGRVTKWDRSWYGIQSVATVGVDLKLVSARDSKLLFVSSAVDSESRGLTKGPTGFSDLVIEPIRGLDSAIVTQLATSIVRKALQPLMVKNRPEFLKTAPPAILATAHDATTGRLASGEHLTVVMLGSPKKTASFSVEGVAENVPMVEKDEGHYVGEFHPLPTDVFEGRTVTVSITDQHGRTTVQKLGGGAVSFSGKA